MKKTIENQQADDVPADNTQQLCYVMMPLGDCDGYKPGHFTRVYEDIIKPACVLAGFDFIRADEGKHAGLISLDILQKNLDSPMAICDISDLEPDVLFQLGLRLAFDKPTVLIQDAGTTKLFDIPTFKVIEYRRDLNYREVLEDQKAIAEAIRVEAGHSDNGIRVNSLAKILSITNLATLNDDSEIDTRRLLQLVHYEMSLMHSEVQKILEHISVKREQPDLLALREDLNSIGDNIPLLKVEECYFRARKLYSAGIERKDILELLKLARNKLIGILQDETDMANLNKARELLMNIADFEKCLCAAKGQ